MERQAEPEAIDYKRRKAGWKAEYAVRISMRDYREEEWLVNLPLYAVHNI